MSPSMIVQYHVEQEVCDAQVVVDWTSQDFAFLRPLGALQ